MTVVASYEDAERARCVDLIARPDGGFGFRECRRDPEDAGRWTLVADFSALRYPTRAAALRAAADAVVWFDPPPA